MAKFFTFMIVPNDGERIRRLRLSNRLLLLVGLCCLLFFGLFGFAAYRLWSVNANLAELQRLRVENGQQRVRLRRLLVDLDDMRQQMIYFADSDARLRQLANLEETPRILPVAMGGAAENAQDVELDEVRQQISQLQLAIDLRRQSQEAVRNLLNDQVSLSRATPQGWPTKGWLTSYFGTRKSPYTGLPTLHEGLDIAASIGTPVVATADGVVARVEYSPSYGKTVVVDHGYGYRSQYSHNSRLLVKAGQRVSRGDKIAEVGNTGRSTGPHLHYEVHLNGVPTDPRKTL